MHRWRRAAVGALALAATSGCAGASVDAAGAAFSVDGPVFVYNARDGAHMEALVSGGLTLHDGCLLLDGHPVIWPAGSRWLDDERTVVLGNDTRVEVGDAIEGSGGFLSPGKDGSGLDHLGAVAEPVKACLRNGITEVAFVNGFEPDGWPEIIPGGGGRSGAG